LEQILSQEYLSLEGRETVNAELLLKYLPTIFPPQVKVVLGGWVVRMYILSLWGRAALGGENVLFFLERA